MRALDPIRIVPVRLEAIAPVGVPKLSYRGGPLLTSVQVFSFFWGEVWQRDPLAGLMNQVNGFFDYVVTSALIDQLDEYSVPGHAIGHGARVGAIALATAPPPSVQDADIRQLVQQEIASDPAVNQPTPNSLYFVFLPPGVTAGLDGATSCVNFCGYHNATGGQIYYAVMPYPDCSGCIDGQSVLDAMTSTSSHELCEAITDPLPGQGYYDDRHGEIGDICAWKTKRLGGYAVQLEWSNQQGGCV